LNDKGILIAPDVLETRLGEPGMRIVDCRFSLLDPEAGRQDYEQAHIPGAVYADLDSDLSGPAGPESGRHPLPEPSALCETFSQLGIDSDTAVVVYDDSNGGVAARAWWLLRWMGHENAMLLDGGIRAWRELALPVETGSVSAVRKTFLGAARHELVLETSAIACDGVGDAPYALVDARSETRFLGEVEPIDPVAGHVPGAVNLPFEANIGENGRWKPADEVGQQLAAVLGNDRSRPWAVMCGSGVTACHLVIAALLGGFAEPRVYVGSWSEWIRDAGRRVATGPAEFA
jgi:thiosulfate/3-mercaptopyruvate sulfurtransferase